MGEWDLASTLAMSRRVCSAEERWTSTASVVGLHLKIMFSVHLTICTFTM